MLMHFSTEKFMELCICVIILKSLKKFLLEFRFLLLHFIFILLGGNKYNDNINIIITAHIH